MGWIRHHGIVVTTWDRAILERAHKVASESFGTVTPIVESSINSFYTFLVGPDGSKEGWPDSEMGNTKRDAFIQWMDAQAYDDGSNALAWLEYEHDVDNGSARVSRFQGASQ